MPNENPNTTIEQLVALLGQNGNLLEAGSAGLRRTELLQKSLNGSANRDETVELARIMANETGLAPAIARVFATESLQKSMASVPVEGLKPVFAEQQAASQKGHQIVAEAVVTANSGYAQWTKAQGLTTAMMGRLLVEQNSLIKSLVSRLDKIESQPVSAPKGMVGNQFQTPNAVQAPVVQTQTQGQAVGQLGGRQGPQLNKSQVNQILMNAFQEASTGKQLPYGLGVTEIQSAMIGIDTNHAPSNEIKQLISDRANTIGR